ncbi:3-mercaptopyruvate sulfurtransferase-like [Eucyclogobius newberryi]|uniref:3-mercaptopyruvate sulfurtransferase-like n=1 Tax=Eucyclogobius newberryi TaxID=166745 RepID=UPI003B591F12
MAAQIRTLVSAQWLLEAVKNNQIGPKLRILDASWYLAKTQRDPRAEFARAHIPGASYFDIDVCCAESAEGLDHMLPTPERFSEYVTELGIGDETHVVVYDTHELGAFSAPRVWWMFRLFGHDMVSVLDGGMKLWRRSDFPLTAEHTPPEPQEFTASMKTSWVKTYEDILDNIRTKGAQVVDARSAGRFRGTEPEPRDDVLPGHYPGTINIPFSSFLNESGKMLPVEDLAKLFRAAGVDVQKPLWTTCGSGVTACVIILGAHLLGQSESCLYDGSWTEWFKKAPSEYIISAQDKTN